MLFSLDYKSRLPIYEQLCRSITKAAALGALEPNAALPSVRSLAQELGINPNTVQKAYQILEYDGIIYSLPGKGSFLSPDASALTRQKELALERLTQAAENAAECGIDEEQAIKIIKNVFSGRDLG